MKSFSIISVLILLFIGWVIFGSTPHVRIERTCQPIMWFKNLGESASMLAGSEKSRVSVVKYMTDLDYGCRYMVWRLVYGDEYKNLQEQKDKNSSGVQGDGADSSEIIM